MVIVDSDVWSEAFRRKSGNWSSSVKTLRELIDREEVIMIGAIRQEVLSGLREKRKYELIRKALRNFPDKKIGLEVYEMAAMFFNACQRRGIQGSHTDFLICACAVSWEMRILSKDRDYERYKNVIPIRI
jgi:hypothetical protein